MSSTEHASASQDLAAATSQDNYVVSAAFDEVGAGVAQTPQLTSGVLAALDRAEKPAVAAPRTSSTVEDAVSRLVDQANPTDQLDLLVTVAAPRPMPVLPDLRTDLPREDPANVPLAAQRKAAFDAEGQIRFASQAPLTDLVAAKGGTIQGQFVLGNSFAAKIPASLVRVLAADPRVTSISLQRTNALPPSPPSDVQDAADTIHASNWNTAGYWGMSPGEYIADLDTGVRLTHVMFQNPARIGWARDCVNGGPYCLYGDYHDYCDHGTDSASIIAGNSNGTYGARGRGLTSHIVDTWKVYDDSNCGLDDTALILAINQSVLDGEKLILTETQSGASWTSTLATTANDAFDSGSVVISANGNCIPPLPMIAAAGPGNAQKVIGVGEYRESRSGRTTALLARHPAHPARALLHPRVLGRGPMPHPRPANSYEA